MVFERKQGKFWEFLQQTHIYCEHIPPIKIQPVHRVIILIKCIVQAHLLTILQTPNTAMLCKFAIEQFNMGRIMYKLYYLLALLYRIVIQPESFQLQILHFLNEFILVCELVSD